MLVIDLLQRNSNHDTMPGAVLKVGYTDERMFLRISKYHHRVLKLKWKLLNNISIEKVPVVYIIGRANTFIKGFYVYCEFQASVSSGDCKSIGCHANDNRLCTVDCTIIIFFNLFHVSSIPAFQD